MELRTLIEHIKHEIKSELDETTVRKNNRTMNEILNDMNDKFTITKDVFEKWMTIDDDKIPITSSQINGKSTYDNVRYLKDNVLHLGQLKLLVSEICFLTKFMHMKNILVVYVGGAEGYHIKKLAELFPNMYFELYDACKFSITETDNIKIFNRYFTDVDANNYKKSARNILFISDIRNHPMKDVKDVGIDSDVEKNVVNDMEMQEKWVRIIEPYASSLKFRLPYEFEKSYRYLDGYRMLQPYAPFSTEVRLFTIYKNSKTGYNKCMRVIDKNVIYDCVVFDEKMAYFNSQIRNTNFHRWKEQFMMGHIANNWDNTVTFYILQEYLKKSCDIIDDDMVSQLFIEIVDYLGERYGRKYNYIFCK